MIWNDTRIKEWASSGGVMPYDESLVNPASLDLRLGNMIREPHRVWSYLSTADMLSKIADGTIYDLPMWGDSFEFESYWLMPRGHGANFILCHSLEFVHIPDDMAAILYSKSSTGRRGVEHLHAGFRIKGYFVGPAKAGRVTVQLTGRNKQTGAPMTINSTYPAQFVEVYEWS